jgi:hypothetical protein
MGNRYWTIRSKTAGVGSPVDTVIESNEGSQDAEGLLVHLDNVAPLLEEALKLAEIIRVEIHGSEEELARLREPLSKLNPTYFKLEYGFRRS